ncbi:MAG: type VII toxin-antitoxin system HepT family RNase toxin, partial [Gemmatimonadota bacterium]
LQLAVQAALDAASHIVADERLGEPATNRELFSALERAGWIDEELARRLRDMAGFRNMLVRGYASVEMGIVESVLAERLDDLLELAVVVRARMAGGAS